MVGVGAVKVCSKCGEAKGLDEFYVYKRSKDGLDCWCKECKKASARQYRADNLEMVREKENLRYHSGKHGADYARWWRATNRERVRENDRRRRQRHRARPSQRVHNGQTVSDPTTLEWVRVLRGDPCAYCGGEADSIDHIDPNGPDDWTNMVAACRGCNGRKYRKDLLIFLAHRNGCYEYRQDVAA